MGFAPDRLGSEWSGLCIMGRRDSCHHLLSQALLVPTGASGPVPRTKPDTCPTTVSASQPRGWNPRSGLRLGPFWKGLSRAAGGCPPTLSSKPQVRGRALGPLAWGVNPGQAHISAFRSISSYLLHLYTRGHLHHTHNAKSQKKGVNSRALLLQRPPWPWEERGSLATTLTFSSDCGLCALSISVARNAGAHGECGTCLMGLGFLVMRTPRLKGRTGQSIEEGRGEGRKG